MNNVCSSNSGFLLVLGTLCIHLDRHAVMILDTWQCSCPLQHLGVCYRQIQNTHCLQLFQCFHQQQIQLVKVSVNHGLLKVFREEDMGVDASAMRYVQQVLIQYDDYEAR